MKQSEEHVRKRIAAGLATRAANKKPPAPKLRCSVEHCTSPMVSRGLCNMHYLRMSLHGSTDKPVRKRRTIAETLAFRSVVTPSGCHEWQGPLKGGYGSVWYEEKVQPAHRVAWLLKNGTLLHGLQVNHFCHNRCCVNPEHLYAGTQKENMADMKAAGRARYVFGERKYNAKLTAAEVVAIRKSDATTAALARSLEVSQSLVRAVRQGRIWKHVHAE